MFFRSAFLVFFILLVTGFPTGNLYGRGLLGNLGRSLRQVGREVGYAVRDTTQDIKSDVQTETGIPIAQIEMRDRLGKIKKKINAIRVAVIEPDIADGAVLYFWNTVRSMDMGDSENLRKVVEYTEGTIIDIRKDGISAKKLQRGVEKLEGLLMSLASRAEELPEGFDFTAYFGLNPRDPESGAPEVSTDSYDDGSGGEYTDADGDSEATAVDNGAGVDPVTARYEQLLKEHGDSLSGSGYLKVSVGTSGGSDAGFSLIHPGTGAILTQGADVNRNHRLECGIYHVVVDVADVRLYKLNVVIGPGTLIKLDYSLYGQIEIAESSQGGIDVYDGETERLACEALNPGEIITLPEGNYIVVHNDSGAEQNVQIKNKKRKRISF